MSYTQTEKEYLKDGIWEVVREYQINESIPEDDLDRNEFVREISRVKISEKNESNNDKLLEKVKELEARITELEEKIV